MNVSSDKLIPAQSTAIVRLPAKQLDETNTQWLQRLAELLPAPSEDVADRLVGEILGSPDMVNENMIWESTSSRELINHRFVWHGIAMQPSTESDGLPFFLVCDVTDRATGEKKVITTGSLNLCASLIRAHFHNAFPWEGEIVGPRRPPKNGRMPLHMRWVARVVMPEDGDDD